MSRACPDASGLHAEQTAADLRASKLHALRCCDVYTACEQAVPPGATHTVAALQCGCHSGLTSPGVCLPRRAGAGAVLRAGEVDAERLFERAEGDHVVDFLEAGEDVSRQRAFGDGLDVLGYLSFVTAAV